MAQKGARPLRSWERAAALLAVAVAIVLNVAASLALFGPQGTFGYRLIYARGFEVATVDPGTSAASAAILPGDRLDLRESKLHDRIIALGYQPPLPGERAAFVVVRAGHGRLVVIPARPLTKSESQSALASPVTSILRLTGFAYIAVALVILLRRPGRLTWGLFLYLVSSTNVSTYHFPDTIFPIVQFASDILDVVGPIGLIVFAARFPNDRATGWRSWLDRIAVPVGALWSIPNLAWDATSLFRGVGPSPWMSLGSTLGGLSMVLVAGLSLVVTYATAKSSERQRLQWVIAGVLFTLLSYVSAWARYLPASYPLASSDPVVWIGTVLYAGAPFAIAYAVIRQRVFDVSFVLSRTLAYSIVTATIFGVFAVVEWLASRLVEYAGATVALVALTAVGIAFSLHAIYTRVERLVVETLFRRRRLAQRHLARVAYGLSYAQNTGTIESALVREPLHAYGLSCARLFERVGSGEYLDEGTALERSVPLQLQGLRRPLRLHDGEAALAVPIFMRLRLQAVAVYGAHANGEDIDPDEAASLQALAVAAGIAYEHLETARLERDLAHWHRVAERQARELAALRPRAT